MDYGCGSGALAKHVEPDQYVGYDPDGPSIRLAWRQWPQHTFTNEPPPLGEFDTVATLAVLEHIAEPEAFLETLIGYLAPGGRVVLTTPHPRLEFAHTWGARVGLFSREAHEEHEALLDETAITQVADGAGLRMETYERFLWGANQLAVLSR